MSIRHTPPHLTPYLYTTLFLPLVAYLFTNLGAFTVIVALTQRGQDADRLEDFTGLARTRPALAALMTLFMVSLRSEEHKSELKSLRILVCCLLIYNKNYDTVIS